MNIRRRTLLHQAARVLAIAAIPGSGRAETYPARAVRIVVGFAAGGNFDIVARLIGTFLSERLGQPFIVENRPGASGGIATEAVVHAAADGHTLLLCGAVNAVNSTLQGAAKPAFADTVTPVGGAVRFPNVVTVSGSFPARSIPELLALARSDPGKINYGSSGIGTTQHLAGELFKLMAGVDLTHIPYKGASAALTDLLGGHVQLLFEALPASMPFIRSGQIRALALTTAARSDTLPAVPTVGEFLPGYDASGWNGLCAPRNTPADVVTRLNAALNAALSDPAIRSRMADLGAVPLAGTPAEFGTLIANETEKWAKVIRFANIRIE